MDAWTSDESLRQSNLSWTSNSTPHVAGSIGGALGWFFPKNENQESRTESRNFEYIPHQGILITASTRKLVYRLVSIGWFCTCAAANFSFSWWGTKKKNRQGLTWRVAYAWMLSKGELCVTDEGINSDGSRVNKGYQTRPLFRPHRKPIERVYGQVVQMFIFYRDSFFSRQPHQPKRHYVDAAIVSDGTDRNYAMCIWLVLLESSGLFARLVYYAVVDDVSCDEDPSHNISAAHHHQILSNGTRVFWIV